MAIQFKEIKPYIARNVRISICFKDGFYHNYNIISDIPDSKYDELYVYGIGMVDVEFSKDVYMQQNEPDGVQILAKDYTLKPAMEIVLQKEPGNIERNVDDRLVFGDLKPYIQAFGFLSIVDVESWDDEGYEFRRDVPGKYDDWYLYGIGMENNPNVDESVRSLEYDTWRKKRLVIVLSKQPRRDIIEKKSTYGKGPFFILITAEEWNHDADEWIGIYIDKKEAREVYDRVLKYQEEERNQWMYNAAQKVVIFEFISEENRFRQVERCELE